MRYSLLCVVVVLGTLLFSLAACDDSSNVGLGVGADSLTGGVPHTLEITPDPHYTTTQAPLTGRTLEQGTWRFLTGRVTELPEKDGYTYTVAADGYVDFLGRSSLPDEIASAEASELSAELRLTRSYLHGDTSSTIDVSVYNLTEEAEMNQATADTTFAAESDPIQRASVSPTDSLVTIDLPAAWIENHLEVLQSTDDDASAFVEDFHGFKLTARDEEVNVVVGFSSTETTLRLTHEPDTVTADFQSIKSFTHINQLEAPSSVDNHLLLQDGIGRGLSMEWNFDSPPLDTLQNAPLNRAEIYIPVDSLELAESESNSDFVRPTAQGFRITATQAPNAPSCSALGALTRSETECVLPLIPQSAPEAAHVGTDTAFPIFEEALLNASPFTSFRVEIADRSSTDIQQNATVNPGLPSVLPVLIPQPDSSEVGLNRGPRAILTVTQL